MSLSLHGLGLIFTRVRTQDEANVDGVKSDLLRAVRHWRNPQGCNPWFSKDDIAPLHTSELRELIESREWHGRATLGRFDSGAWFLWLDLPREFPTVTPQSWLEGTRWAGIPFHVTLGQGSQQGNMFLQQAVPPEGVQFTWTLRKWGRHPGATAYRVAGGTLYDFLTTCEAAGFAPGGRNDWRNPGAWHISL